MQVVCGANNVAAGQTVIWLPPGATVPETHGSDKPFVLEAKDLRGVKSHGMIASARELDFGDDHAGIVVLPDDFKPGTPLTEAYDLSDYIIDIENKMFTHRPDLFGILGIAREIAGIQNIPFASPTWYTQTPSQVSVQGLELPLAIKNELPELVPRFMAVAMSNVTVKPSPLQLQTYLFKLGIRPINNVVDITNFMMLLTAQPLHAYDYDKVKAQDNGANQATLCTRYPTEGEKLTLLGGKELQPRAEAILIATATKAIGLGGVMGGFDTEVDATTKNIIIECANFDMYSIRKTAMTHGLFTDAVTRFSKGQNPLQNDKVLAQTIKTMHEVVGAEIASQIIDDKHLKTANPVLVTPKFINDRLGLNRDASQIVQTLQNVDFIVTNQGETLSIEPPFWRTDIEIPEDVVEEVGRLLGYDKLPLELPKRSLKPAKTNDLLKLKDEIRQILQAAGANELLTYSFVHGNLLEKSGQNRELAYQLSNALSPDLQYYRLSILPSLLEKVHPNIKADYDQFALFEIGKTHIKDWLDEEKLPIEEEHLALVFAANLKSAKDYSGAPYFEAQNYLSHLLAKLGIHLVFTTLPEHAELKINEQMVAPFETSRSAMVTEFKSGELIGVVGEFKSAVRVALKLPEFTTGFEVDVAKILKFKSGLTDYIPLPKYPKVEQDISLKTPNNVTFAAIFDFVYDEINKIKPANSFFELSPLDIYQRPDDQDHKQFAFRLKIASYEKTLKAEEVNGLLDSVASAASQKFGAERL